MSASKHKCFKIIQRDRGEERKYNLKQRMGGLVANKGANQLIFAPEQVNPIKMYKTTSA